MKNVKEIKEMLEVMEHDPGILPDNLAVMLGMDVEEVTKGVRELENSGVIRGYRTIVDWDAIGEEYVYAVIELNVALKDRRGYDAVAERIAGFPEVLSVRLISGGYDLSLTVRGKSMKEVAFFVAEKIAPLEQIHGTATHFVLKTYKENGAILFDEKKPERLSITP
ncbi:MAG: Lrp/AsnC family transcriptional regulator [Methanosarcinales archaeon]|uniref:Lrp/AsnC family transcriptional regulator n=1 Tax=Candidatus Ethanoperedens thermophilum TaxID=2766897 RepID=A0A848DA98_9EURY|nr:Lrp/AsnC family transcriptional regulator [Candidatus Ethanoperedens thermophilum]